MMEIKIIRALQELSNPVLDEFFRSVTYLASPTVIVIAIMFLISLKGWRCGLRAAWCAAIALGLNLFLKAQFKALRPYEKFPDVFVFNEAGYSFPSGHAMVGLAFWFWFAMETDRKDGYNPRVKGCYLWLVAAIGLSRCYFGVHYPSDVLFGYMLGLCAVVVALITLELCGWKIEDLGK